MICTQSNLRVIWLCFLNIFKTILSSQHVRTVKDTSLIPLVSELNWRFVWGALSRQVKSPGFEFQNKPNHYFGNNNSETPKIKSSTTYWTKNTRVKGIRKCNQTDVVNVSTYHSVFYPIVYEMNDTNQRPYFVRWRRHLSAAAASADVSRTFCQLSIQRWWPYNVRLIYNDCQQCNTWQVCNLLFNTTEQ